MPLPHVPADVTPTEISDPVAGVVLYCATLLLVLLALVLLLATVLGSDDDNDPDEVGQ